MPSPLFAERYPRNRYLLTCRVLAYQPPANPATPDNLRLPTHQFPIFELAPFGEEKIMAFIQAWYNELARAGTVTSQDAPGLIQQLQTAIRRPDLWTLAANPLLLTVMALVHSHKGRLPSARALLYEETIDILLWRWEQVKRGGQGETPLLSRLLAEAGQVEMDLKKVLWRLAFEVHSQSGTNGDVADIGEWQLRKTLATLKEGNLDWAGQIIEVMKMRAGLLLERAPELFTFPHRTFQEYLAGAHLTVMQDFASKAATLAGEGALWREVILLAVGRLIFLQGDLEKPLALVNRLCPGKPGYAEKEWRKTWLAGDALLTCGLQRVQKDEWGVELLERVQERLVLLLQQGALTARERAEVGDVLAQLGDPRPELLTLDGMQFCFVPAGDFWMGSNESNDEKPQHLNQQLRYDYYLGRYPVTVAQWQAYIQASGHEPIDDSSLADPPNRPVRYVTWHEARGFCAWLTQQWQKAGWLPDGWQVRLPSEAEWEKAARGGVKLPETRLSPVLAADLVHRRAFTLVDNLEPRRRYPWGEKIESEQANINETGIGTTSVLGCFPGNVSPYGCIEMSGNLFEWTRSLWGENWEKPSFGYPYSPQDGREDEKAADRVWRVIRGGSWTSNASRGRCAFRLWHVPFVRNWYFGFRAVVSPSTSGL
ncbi:MAG: SUMF1/EgtB/PvdO family nonheme iron enzyme [Candidatus Promineifilaceae bacterium]